MKRWTKWNRNHWWFGAAIAVLTLIATYAGWLDEYARVAFFLLAVELLLERIANALGLKSDYVKR